MKTEGWQIWPPHQATKGPATPLPQGLPGSNGVLSNAFGHSDILYEYNFNE